MYCDGNVRLTLRAHNSLAGLRIGLRWQLRLASGEISPSTETMAPSANRASNFSTFAVPRGELISVGVFANAGAPIRGQSFIQVGLTRGGELASEPCGLLISDYLPRDHLLGWPGSELRNSLEGPGWIRSVTGTNPAAGVEIAETVPTGARWRFISLQAQLVTSATAANRRVHVLFDDGVNTWFEQQVQANQTAGQTVDYMVSNYGSTITIDSGKGRIPTCADAFLAAGHRIRTATTALQAGDDWNEPQLLVEEWIVT